MHDTAFELGQLFFKTYLTGRLGVAILDVGSLNVNGSLRQCAPVESVYTGVDLIAGDGVDIVLEESHKLPFGAGVFDAVVSTSCFEHDPMFWLTFIEIVRVTKPGGIIYVSAPSNGCYHRYPLDNWRFYPDAGISLEAWARHQGFELRLLELFIARRRNDVWNDCVMVFERGPTGQLFGQRMCDDFSDAMNVRRSDRPDEIFNRFDATEDQRFISLLLGQLGERDARIARLEQELNTPGGTTRATSQGGAALMPPLAHGHPSQLGTPPQSTSAAGKLSIAATMMEHVGGVSQVRIANPLQALAEEPGVSVQIITKGVFPSLPADTGGICILHRAILAGAPGLEVIRDLLAKGYVVVSEFDDNPEGIRRHAGPGRIRLPGRARGANQHRTTGQYPAI